MCMNKLQRFVIAISLVFLGAVSTGYVLPSDVEAKTVVIEHHASLAKKKKILWDLCKSYGGAFSYDEHESLSGDIIGQGKCTDTEIDADFDCSFDTETTICEHAIQVPEDFGGPRVDLVEGGNDAVQEGVTRSPHSGSTAGSGDDLFESEPTPTPVPEFKE